MPTASSVGSSTRGSRMRSKIIVIRWNFGRVVGAVALAISSGALPGSAQDGGTSQLVLNSFTGPSSINFGGTGDYTVRITNAGPNDATGVRMDATLPPITVPNAPDAGLRVTATSSNCARVNPNQSGPLPCNLPVNNEFTSIAASFTVQLPLPGKVGGVYSFPCPAPFTMGPTTVVVTAQNDTFNPDGGVSGSVNSSAAVRPFADIRASLSGPPTAKEGDTIQYQAAVSNLGPCPANDVTVSSGAAGDIIFGSNSGDCTTAFPCALGIIAPGTSKNFTSSYTIDKLPDKLKSTGDPNPTTAPPSPPPVPDGGGNLRAATFDPDTTNNTASTTTRVSLSPGCNVTSASLGSLPLFVVLVGLAVRRRNRRSK